MDLIQYVGSIGGVAGVMALLMFLMVRHLISQIRSDRKYMEDRLTKVIDDYHSSCNGYQEDLVKHTQVLTELTTWLKAKNGSR